MSDTVPQGHVNNPAMHPKLTKWAKEPVAGALKADLEAARPSQQAHVLKIKKWNDLSKVEGTAAVKKIKGRSSVQPKLIRRQAEWRYSALTEPFLGTEKLFTIKPRTFEDKLSAEQNELVINWQFRTKLNKVKFIDDFVRSNVDEGSCIVRLGWNRVTVPEVVNVPVWAFMQPQSQEQMDELQLAIQLKQDNPREFNETLPEAIQEAVSYWEENGIPTVAVQTGTTEITQQKVIDNRPTLRVENPENVFIDPSCNGDINAAKFVIVSFETSKADLLKEPDRYKNLEYINWEGASILNEVDHSSTTPQDFNFRDALRKRVVAYEYWGYYDVEGNDTLTPIVATWIGDTLIRLEENPFPDQKPPFIVTNYMPVKRELMGEPDAELLEDNQKILGAVARGMIDLLGRSANGQQGMAKGMLDVVNRRRFENGQDYEFNPQTNPANNYIQHTYPEIPQSALMMLSMQNQEAEALTGVKAFSGGVSGDAYGDVAAGIRGALDAASKREMAILRRIAKGIIDIGSKIIAMNQVFLSEEEVIRVTNAEFVTIRREDLAGNFDLEVDISTAEIDNAKAQDLAFMLQTIGNNMDFSMVQMILAEIAKLKRMPDLAKRIIEFQPQPDPLLVKEQELKIAKLEAEIMEIQARTKQLQADAQKKLAEADQTTLDVIEQETGTEHERNLEQARAQAAGNQQNEVTKAILKPRKKADGGETEPDIEAAIGFNELSKSLAKDNSRPSMPSNPPQGNIGAAADPSLSLDSGFFNPKLDPAVNPAINI